MRVVLPLVGRGALPHVVLEGRSLLQHALASLPTTGSGAIVVAEGATSALEDLPHHVRVVGIDELRQECEGQAVVVHDPLCPLTSSAFMATMLERFVRDQEYAAAAHRPVTDTIKRVHEGCVTETIDREGLGIVTSPVLLSAQAVADLADDLACADLADLVERVRRHGPVTLVKAPSMGRRVDNESAVRLLECVAEMSRELRA